MSRRIWTGQSEVNLGLAGEDAPSPVGSHVQPEEDFLGRLLKYIPAEIVGLYLAVRGVVPFANTGDDQGAIITLWVIAVLCWILVPVYMWIATSRDGKKPLMVQIVLATVAYPVWVFAIGGPPVSIIGWLDARHYIISIVLIFTTFVFGLIRPAVGV